MLQDFEKPMIADRLRKNTGIQSATKLFTIFFHHFMPEGGTGVGTHTQKQGWNSGEMSGAEI